MRWQSAAILATALCMSACGPNAAPLGREASVVPSTRTSPTPAAWQTPTPDRATRGPTSAPQLQTASTPTAAPAPTVMPPRLGAAERGTPALAPVGTAPVPTATRGTAPFPTPTPEPDIVCQFASGTVRVPSNAPVPTPNTSTAGWVTVAAGEPMPGVSLELRLPSLTAIAGSMLTPTFVVHNSSAQEISISGGVAVKRDPAGTPPTRDPREFFVVPRTGPLGAYESRVPIGQTREVPGREQQLPFDANRVVQLTAGAALGLVESNGMYSSRSTSVQVDVPIQLVPPTSSDELKLELVADRQQWCLRATDARGGRPNGPLSVAVTVRNAGGFTSMGELPTTTSDTWARRWAQYGSQNGLSGQGVTLSVWVAGPHYVTAHAEVSINP